MRRTYAALVASLLVSSALAGATLPNDPLPPDLLKAAQDYDEAQLTNDGSALQRLLGDDLVLISSSGRTESKAEFISDSTSRGFKIEPFTILEPVHKVMGDTAILGGVVMLKGTADGKPFAQRMRFSDTWHKRNGRWQVVYVQVTRLPNS
jgi:ketosteroid isomerase-like protein